MVPIHPSLVHFPIVLLFIAGILYVYEFFKANESLQKIASWAHLAGGIAVIVAIVSGEIAEGDLVHTKEIHAMLQKHGLCSWILIWGSAVLFVWQLLRNKKFLSWEKGLFTFLFVCLLAVMSYSAHIGGEMVYEKGAGVLPMKEAQKIQFQQEQEGKTKGE